MAACESQYAAAASYCSRSSATPLPPWSRPSALRIMVMGCIGVSNSSSWALMLMMPQGEAGSCVWERKGVGGEMKGGM